MPKDYTTLFVIFQVVYEIFIYFLFLLEFTVELCYNYLNDWPKGG